MESKLFLKSSVSAAFILAAANTLLNLLFSFIVPNSGQGIMITLIAAVLFAGLTYILLGLLPAYLYRRWKGEITLVTCILLMLSAVIFHLIFSIVAELLLSAAALIFFIPSNADVMGVALIPLIGLSFALNIIWKSLLTLLGLIPALLGATAAFYLYASIEEKKKTGRKALIPAAAAIAAVVVLLIPLAFLVLWNINLGPSPTHSGPTTVGFVKIKPLNSGQLTLSEVEGFSGVFVNAAGGTITLTDMSIVFSSPSDAECTGPAIVQTPGGEEVALENNNTLSVGQGNTFELRFEDCSGLEDKNRYSAAFTINYTQEVGGFIRERTEQGTIAGPIVS